jgi:hypothetical protein
MLTKYRQSAEDWDAASGDVRRANRLFVANHQVYKRLRGSSEGRGGIAALLADSCPGVRLLAATHSLEWNEAGAVAVLEELERAGGLHVLEAKYTLREYRSGRLNLEW